MPDTEFGAVGLRPLFERFESRRAAPDAEGLATMYAEEVMMAGPSGARVVRSADLRLAIPKRRRLLESAGCQGTTLAGFDESALTGRYSLVRAQFQWRFDAANAEAAAITLPSTFVVDRGGQAPRIVLYMNEQDVVSVLRERGVLPPLT